MPRLDGGHAAEGGAKLFLMSCLSDLSERKTIVAYQQDYDRELDTTHSHYTHTQASLPVTETTLTGKDE